MHRFKGRVSGRRYSLDSCHAHIAKCVVLHRILAFRLSCGVMVCGGGMLGLPTVPDLIEAARENLATAKDKGLPCSACAPTSGE